MFDIHLHVEMITTLKFYSTFHSYDLYKEDLKPILLANFQYIIQYNFYGNNVDAFRHMPKQV